VPGHNDGLRILGDGQLWALQNEDANPNLVVIDLETGGQTPYEFAPPPHGGGYDDIVVAQNGEVYLTASNPNLNAPRSRPWATSASLPARALRAGRRSPPMTPHSRLTGRLASWSAM
jgi:hypothetical protein